ncbi:Hypoxia up-regulated 1 [Hyphodiscus hymeniophilus]|uniref:Hypoxia up-regulated 1 n=1 Tax=Hyphodiscus hymeniophilus TaxID=353542 RepID=A0A9P7AX74_9HELO|nr:Hypoxia up-regulated 1 [Hyphodiscus hymeniophilus]
MARSRNSNRFISSPLFSLLCLFCVFSSTALAASAVLGVDLGTEYIKAALVKPGIPLEIVLTKDSRRKEASTVAFKPPKNPQSGSFPERAYGSDAVALSARFPGDVYSNLKVLLGLPADNSLVTEYASRHPALRLETEKTRGTAAFRSGAFAEDEEPFSVEELLAMELQSIQKNAEALAGSRVKDIVMTVPPFYSAEEKRAVKLAAELAGLRVLELVSDGLAVGLNYATSRTFPSVNEGGKPEIHLVFDMGAGSTKATLLKFQGRTVKDVGKFNKTIQEVQVLGTGWDRTLGGDALNAVIVDDMVTQFIESKSAKSVSPTIESVKGHGRAAAKLWKEAERLRQVLSANTNTQASFEGLYEDVDFRYKISRADFEKLAEPHAARISPAIQKALDIANVKVTDIDSVILHGGAIRTPFVQKELEKFIGSSDKVRTNVNADEAAVFGAGFRGAGLSPSFRVKEIRSSEGVAYRAGMKWTNTNGKPQHQQLWQATSFLGAEKQYTFKNQIDPFEINFYQHVGSDENVSPGSAEKELLTVTTKNLTESVAQLKTKFGCDDAGINLHLSTRLSPVDGEVEIVKLVLDCEVEDTDKPGMVDSMKGLFGFGKKDQAPLSEDGEEPLESSVTESATTSSTSSSTSSSAPAKSATKESKDSKEPKSKPSKHLEIVPIEYTIDIKGSPQLPALEKSRMKDRITAFDDSDRSRRLREEALNQLEGYTYHARDLLDNEDFVAVSTQEERTNLETKAKAASEWIYSGGSDATREELKAKLKEMRDIVGPIESRKEEAAGRPEAIKALQQAINETTQIMDGVMGQIENDTKIHSSFSASKSSAPTKPTKSATVDEFADLEDDATATVSASPEKETLDPPTYTAADLIRPQSLYDSVTKWLVEKLAEQEKLSPTDDPVLLVKDLTAKTKELTDMHVDILMKSMKRPHKTSRKPVKPPKGAKVGKKKSKTGSADKAAPSLDFGDGVKPQIFNFDEDGDMDEQLKAFMEQYSAPEVEEDANTAGTVPEAGKEPEKEETGEKPHDEL